jgi:nitroreductase
MANFAITLQAFDYGLYTHMLGGYKKDQLKEALNIPLHLDPVAILAIGYEGEVEQLPDFLQERAQAPRSRKPLENIVRTEEF